MYEQEADGAKPSVHICLPSLIGWWGDDGKQTGMSAMHDVRTCMPGEPRLSVLFICPYMHYLMTEGEPRGAHHVRSHRPMA